MLKMNIIDYKTKSLILVFLFTLIIARDSIIAVNISIFSNLNINQLGFIKNDS